MPEKAGEIITEEAANTTEYTIRDTTRKGMKKVFSEGLKSFF